MIESGVLLIGVIFVTGFVFGKLTYYLRLTSIVGYVIAGILMGPAFNIVELNSNTMNTVVNFTLALIAFDIGGTFTMDFLKEAGKKVWIIILGESFGAFILVLVGVYILTQDMVTALIFASLAPASAPAGTVAALQETKGKRAFNSDVLGSCGTGRCILHSPFRSCHSLGKSHAWGSLLDLCYTCETSCGDLWSSYSWCWSWCRICSFNKDL